MNKEVITLSQERKASITCYTLDVGGKFVFSKRPAVVVIPGGAYAYCSDREADPVAFSFMKAGYHAFILRYSCKDVCSWPQPLEDYEQAMEIILQNAENWGVDTSRIVTIGFSAGGHLAACTATMAKHRPAASVLVYPALDRDIIDLCMPNLPEPRLFVDENTVPCFLIAARNDDVVDVKSIVHFADKLIEYAIPFESHIYSYGGHGFSIVEDLNRADQTSSRLPHWVSEMMGWLEETLGKQTTTGYTEPNKNVIKNDDSKEYLSLNCSLRHALRSGKEAEEALKLLLEVFDEAGKEVNRDTFIEAFGSITVRDALRKAYLSQDKIDEIEKKLVQIKNHQ